MLQSTIKNFFRSSGSAIARWPLLFGTSSFVAALFLSTGLALLRVSDHIRDGYTPGNAPSRDETAAMRRFWNASGDPMKVHLLVRSKLADRNMLRVDLLSETLRLGHFLTWEFNCSVLPEQENEGEEEEEWSGNNNSSRRKVFSPFPLLSPSPPLETNFFTYSDVCSPYCESNFGFELFVDALSQAATLADLQKDGSDVNKNKSNINGEEEEEGKKKKSWKEKLTATNSRRQHKLLSFPLASIHSIDVHLDWFLFGVKLRQIVEGEGGGEEGEMKEIGRNWKRKTEDGEEFLTNIETVDLVLLTFQADRSSAGRARQLTTWELQAFDYISNTFQSESIDAKLIGLQILESEMTADSRENVHYFSLGLLAICAFVALSVLCTALFLVQLDAGKALLAGATVLCPLLAIGAAFGAFGLSGTRLNSFLLLLPYLVLGIGVDDGFLLMHRWFQLAKCVPEPRARLTRVLTEMGPSITVTTLTNVISFGVGAFTPTPEIRLFCFGTAIALVLDYALQIALFCPLMLFSARFENFQRENNNNNKNNLVSFFSSSHPIAIPTSRKEMEKDEEMPRERTRNSRKYSLVKPTKKFGVVCATKKRRSKGKVLLDFYCALLTNRCFAFFTLLLFALYLCAAIAGSMRIRTELDLNKILPANSLAHESTLLLERHVWANYLPVTVLLQGPLNVSSSEQMALFWAMVHEFEAIPSSKGAHSSMLWFRDYEQFACGSDDFTQRLKEFIEEIGGGIAEMERQNTKHVKSNNNKNKNNNQITNQKNISQSQNVENIWKDGEEEEENGERKEEKKKGGNEDNRCAEQQSLDLCQIVQFLDSPFYSHWRASIRFEENMSTNNCPSLSAFTLTFAFRGVSNWGARVELMERCRSIAAHFSERFSDKNKNKSISVSVWEENAMFVDQMLSLARVTLQSVLLTICCMALVCWVFVPCLLSILVASASICSISVGVLGFLAWFGFDLDPITMAAMLMSIGLSVDFIAHVIYHFRQNVRYEFTPSTSSSNCFIERRVPLNRKRSKLEHTFESVGWPMLQSGVSTVLCVLPVALLHKYAPSVFVHSILLVCGWGLLHGLLFVPCLICHLPELRATLGIGKFFAARGEFQVRDAGERVLPMTTINL